jgi:hypothetical protein
MPVKVQCQIRNNVFLQRTTNVWDNVHLAYIYNAGKHI